MARVVPFSGRFAHFKRSPFRRKKIVQRRRIAMHIAGRTVIFDGICGLLDQLRTCCIVKRMVIQIDLPRKAILA